LIDFEPLLIYFCFELLSHRVPIFIVGPGHFGKNRYGRKRAKGGTYKTSKVVAVSANTNGQIVAFGTEIFAIAQVM
jgi:hypothetical protein